MKLLKLIFYTCLFIFLFSPTKAQGLKEFLVYVSPGIRLGYVFGEGFTWSSEITFGVWNNYDAWSTSVALGYQHIPKNPTSFTYIALQGGYTFFGLSYGVAFYKDEGVSQLGGRLSGFAGFGFAFLSYEHLQFSSLPASYQTIGIWGKYPIIDYGELYGPLATCFAEGTEIAMADGSLKSIEDIKVGDSVLSYNLETRETEPDEVLELYSPTNNNMMRMEFSDGTVIHSTFDHPYYVKNKGWCSLEPDVTNDLITNISDVGQLEEGDVCHLLKHGQLTEVVFVGSQRILTFQRTYTIKKLKKNNTFFAEGILVGVETVKEIKSKSLLGYLK